MESKVTGRKFLLLGAGDLAREVAGILREATGTMEGECDIAVFSETSAGIASEFQNFCIRPADAQRKFPPSEWQAIGCVGTPRVRDAMYTQFSTMGYSFATVCHPDATVFKDQLGPGCVVFPGACIAIGCRLAEDVIINFNATIGHDTVIGAHSVVAPGVQLGGRIVCGERVVFGIGSSVLQRIHIGHDSVISAGASVWTDVPSGASMVGVPAVVRKVPGRSATQEIQGKRAA